MNSSIESLLRAITEGDIPTIQYCINRGVNVNKICVGGITPLTAAVQSGNLSVIKLLAESTTKKQPQPELNDNSLLSASQYKNIGYFVVCRDLDDNELGEGSTPDGMDALEWDMEISDASEESPRESESNIYKWCANILNKTSILLDSPEYDISRLDCHGQNVLHYAIKNGNKEIVEYLLKNYTEININQCDANWCSPLHIAAQFQRVDLITYLLTDGADVNACNTNRQTPLHFAAQTGNTAIVKLLLNHGANVNIYDLKDRTPLSLAVQNGHEDVSLVLIASGTKLNQEECFGDTVLYKAVRNKLCRTVKSLLKAGAKMIHSHMLLHVAIRQHCVELVRVLCEAGALVNIRDVEGYTPLMSACMLHDWTIAEYLLRNGAAVNAPNQINGLTALHVCVQQIFNPTLFTQFLELLLSYNANLDVCCYHGSLMFHALVVHNIGAAAALIRHGLDVNRKEPHVGFDYLSLVKKHGNLELVRLVILAGFRFENLSFELKSLRVGGKEEIDEIYEYMVYAKSRPLSLRELCRVRVRKCLGRRVKESVRLLPLPVMIQRYLTFDIL